MRVNGPSAQNQQPLKMVKLNARKTPVCLNVVMVSWSMDLQRASVLRVMMTLSLSTRNLEHVTNVQKMVAQKWVNQINHPAVNQLVANQLETSQLETNQPETNQLEVNQPVASQLEKNHQQENARTSPLCLVKTLFSLLIVLLMTLVKCLVMSNAQTDNFSWVKTARPVPRSPANARDQNANGSTAKRRLLTVKSSLNGSANNYPIIFIAAINSIPQK